MADDPSRILLVRPSALGDVARTVPALVSLKRAFPAAAIDWLVQDSFADVVRHHPALHEAIEFPRKRFAPFGRSAKVTGAVLSYLRELGRRGYDRVYDLQGLSRSGWLTWATRAKRRVGPADARELAWLAYNRRIKVPIERVHTVDRMLAVIEGDGVEAVCDMQLHVGGDDRAWARRCMAEHGLEPGRFAVIAPVARWLSKTWPAERFEAVAQRLGEHGVEACVIVGAESERPHVGPLLEAGAAPRRIDRIGATTVGQLMAIIEPAALLLGNDSAALHIAIGLGVRAVGLYGPTDPAKVGPYRYDIGVVAADHAGATHYRAARDDQSVIARITVEQVAEAIGRVMAAPAPASPNPAD